MLGKKALSIFGATVLLVFLLFNVSHASLINGDFSSGLDGWTTEGDVSKTGDEEAALGDDNKPWSALYQPIKLAPLTYTIEFDFLNNLSGVVPAGTFLDTFYASLYFINDITQFHLLSLQYDESQPLADMDANGVFNDYGGSIVSSAKGGEWQHFSMSFYNAYTYVIPTFELSDFNFIDKDSQVFIDNVRINPVPEPATILLLGAGLAGLGGFVRKKKRTLLN